MKRGSPPDCSPVGEDAVAALLILEGYLTFCRNRRNNP